MLTRYFNADTGGGTGGGQTDDRQQLQGLLQRHNNDAMAVIATLLTENHELRGERRTLRQRQEELQSQLPAADALVLAVPNDANGTKTTDVLFTNAAGGDFTLQVGSPAIGAGEGGATCGYTGP